MQQESINIFFSIEIQKFLLQQTATWNDMKVLRSKIVFNAKFSSNVKDQAKHFVTRLKNNPRKAQQKKDPEFVSRHFTKNLRRGCHEADRAVRRSHVVTRMKMLSKLIIGTKKIGLMHEECSIARIKTELLFAFVM